MAALVAPVMPWTTGAAAFESRTSSAFTSTPIRPVATPAAVASPAEWTLEAGAWVAANARGIPRKIFARRRRTTDAWRPRFTGEKNRVILNDCAFRAGLTCRRSDQFAFGARLLGAGVFRRFGFCTVTCFVIRFHMLAESCCMLGAFVCRIGLGFRTCGRAASLHFLAFFLGNFARFGGVSFFRLLGGFHFLFRLVVELSAAYDSISFRLVLHLLMFGFDKVRGEGRDLIFAQLCFPANLLHRLVNLFLLASGNLGCRRALLCNWGRLGGCFGTCISQDPPGETTGETARKIRAAGQI